MNAEKPTIEAVVTELKALGQKASDENHFVEAQHIYQAMSLLQGDTVAHAMGVLQSDNVTPEDKAIAEQAEKIMIAFKAKAQQAGRDIVAFAPDFLEASQDASYKLSTVQIEAALNDKFQKLILLKKPRAALEMARALTNIDRDNPQYRYDTGVCFFNVKNYVEAMSWFKMAAEMNPSDTDFKEALEICEAHLKEKILKMGGSEEPDNSTQLKLFDPAVA